MFTTEHYQAISAVIKRQVQRGNEIALAQTKSNVTDTHSDFAIGIHSAASVIAGELADTFERDNSRFERDLFLKACGLEQ